MHLINQHGLPHHEGRLLNKLLPATIQSANDHGQERSGHITRWNERGTYQKLSTKIQLLFNNICILGRHVQVLYILYSYPHAHRHSASTIYDDLCIEIVIVYTYLLIITVQKHINTIASTSEFSIVYIGYTLGS